MLAQVYLGVLPWFASPHKWAQGLYPQGLYLITSWDQLGVKGNWQSLRGNQSTSPWGPGVLAASLHLAERTAPSG